MNTDVIHTGDCLDVLDDLPADSVNMVMTSPPYWNLRDYGHEDQLGLEPTAEEYVDNIADVFDAVARVLRPDGSLWLNLGDTYDDKDLQQIPARVALELQSRGWILRNRATWAKPNPMPQSVKDRLNDTTEAVFHFVRGKSYWYDLDTIRESYSDSMERRKEYQSKHGGHESDGWGGGSHHNGGGLLDDSQTYEDTMHPQGKNPGDVFEVTTKPFADAHFAVYPPGLCEKPIKATCPVRACIECGTPYDGGQKMCDCNLTGMVSNVTKPGIVLDPFAGAGTTCLKAKELGRQFVGIEINPEYADMARARVGLTPHDPSHIRDDDAQAGLEAFDV